jgi:hypothetical protein
LTIFEHSVFSPQRHQGAEIEAKYGKREGRRDRETERSEAGTPVIANSASDFHTGRNEAIYPIGKAECCFEGFSRREIVAGTSFMMFSHYEFNFSSCPCVFSAIQILNYNFINPMSSGQVKFLPSLPAIIRHSIHSTIFLQHFDIFMIIRRKKSLKFKQQFQLKYIFALYYNR